ncbi:hypothetical protein A0U91_08090 [Acetobacter persici]|uniref:Uncharacterized protein n=1 Tax=Acetobacter persici TaxID=1076596 RepID=A0A1U9LEU8_9PROT|nr:hypothetical protein A0U91_08090 [Acetobacter persici]
MQRSEDTKQTSLSLAMYGKLRWQSGWQPPVIFCAEHGSLLKFSDFRTENFVTFDAIKIRTAFFCRFSSGNVFAGLTCLKGL